MGRQSRPISCFTPVRRSCCARAVETIEKLLSLIFAEHSLINFLLCCPTCFSPASSSGVLTSSFLIPEPD